MRVAPDAALTRDGERHGIVDERHIGAARLLRGFMRDAAPALGTLFGGLGQMLLSAARNHGRQSGDAEFGGFLDGPLHAIELVNRHDQRDGQRGIGCKLGQQVEANLVPVR